MKLTTDIYVMSVDFDKGKDKKENSFRDNLYDFNEDFLLGNSFYIPSSTYTYHDFHVIFVMIAV